MLLNDLVQSLLIKELHNFKNDVYISGVQYDSRKVEPGNLFICLKGYTVDGHKFVEQALKKGAIAFLVEDTISVPENISVIKVPDTRRAMAVLADTYYNSPTNRLKAIGITGTNGKTTTSNIIQHVLNDNQLNSGLIGTININYGDVTIVSKNTTPDTLELQQLFNDMHEKEMEYVVMEVSSHALSLGRTRGTKFKTAVFTNFTQDHLDYHKTMEEYAYAKSLLFSQLGNSYHNNESFAVINVDDPMAEKFINVTSAQVVTYGIQQNADVRATNIQITPKGTKFTVNTYLGSLPIETNLIGEFNIYNVLAAISTCLVEGLDLESIAASLRKIKGVPGRFETVFENQLFPVIVDYAHTPDSLDNVLRTVRSFSTGSVICVLGCGGDRDTSKRPIMAAIAERYSTKVILTSDNPRTENPLDILADMEKGLIGTEHETYFKILDRQEAIEFAIRKDYSTMNEKDCVVIVGKGHETYQIIGSDVLHFDDRESAKTAIQKQQETADSSL